MSRVSGTGVLEAWNEQGMEALVVYAFWPDGATGLSELVTLGTGHELTIFADDGSTLWEGTINFCKRRWWDRTSADIRVGNPSKQKGVPYATWLGWFLHQPPLRATLHNPTRHNQPGPESQSSDHC